MDLSLILMSIVMLAFVGSIIYTLVAVGNATASKDNKNETALSIFNITIVNGVFIVILGGASYFYFTNNPAGYDAYVMIMLHIALFMSILSSSISAMHQLS